MIKLPGYFVGFASKTDGSATLRFSTQELVGEDFSDLKKNQGAFGWIVFKPQDAGELTEADMPSEQVEEEGISPSKRLYNRMFVYWKNQKIDMDFDAWRKKQLDILGQRYLDKLND